MLYYGVYKTLAPSPIPTQSTIPLANQSYTLISICMKCKESFDWQTRSTFGLFACARFRVCQSVYLYGSFAYLYSRCECAKIEQVFFSSFWCVSIHFIFFYSYSFSFTFTECSIAIHSVHLWLWLL